MKNPKTHPEVGMLVQFELSGRPRRFWPVAESRPEVEPVLTIAESSIMLIVGVDKTTMIDYGWEANLESGLVEVLVCDNSTMKRIICPATELKLA